MKKPKLLVIKPTKIKHFSMWFALSWLLVLAVIGLAVCIDIRIFGLLACLLPLLLYLLYYRFYFSKCEIRLDDSEHKRLKLIIATPISIRIFDANRVHFVVKRMGLRTPSYIVTILDESGKRIFRMDDSYWESMQYILHLPHKPTSVTRELQARWK